jgi:gamma-glutamylcyclotransferase (GGCT)/AIG2-like uncharacterized protein YtfP
VTAPRPPFPPHLPFFVYGTLRRGERNHALLAGRAASWSAAHLPGALLFEGPGYPFAVVDPAGAGTVHGDLVRIGEEAYGQVLADLDRLETYVPGAAGNLYERVRRTVRGEHAAAEAWVYVANEPLATELLADGRRIEGGDWLTRR